MGGGSTHFSDLRDQTKDIGAYTLQPTQPPA